MTRTILIVEDDPDVRASAVAALEDAGYAVLEAATGDRALVAFDAHPEIDLVLTDIVMPGIDGFKVADCAKHLRPAVRIVYTTAFTHRAADHLGVVHGPILLKPYRPSELVAAVSQALT
ncbi:MAG TPA: response regulator [Candidatus Sulfotelmatobacter sp.]|nr:response regulator [Candidatus Sulfotelmatobacter sp.]